MSGRVTSDLLLVGSLPVGSSATFAADWSKAVSAVPEPSSMAVLALSATAWTLRRRRRSETAG